MRDSQPHSARTIVVTGASSGIGAALAREARARGWNVLAVARRGERLQQLSRETGCATFVADVIARDAATRIVSEAIQQFGRIDVVVNNAGAADAGMLLEQSDTQVDRQWALHVAAPIRLARAALAHVEAAGGGFVFVGSGLARVPAPGYGAYASAKAAVRAASIQLRRELRARGVFVTYVDPGVVDTEFSHASGMESHPAWWHAKPHRVATRILDGVERRAARVNAVPWQTAGTVAGEWFSFLADRALASLVTAPAAPRPVQQEPIPPQPASPATDANGFDDALEPLRRRMERVKLPAPFVRSLLVPETTIDANDAAMRWAGMPNKNERAALTEVLEALEAASYLERAGEFQWRVLRAP